LTPDPYTQLAHHLHALGMGYPLKGELVDILRANFSPAEAKVALALPNTRIPLELATADEVAANLGRVVKEVVDVLEELARRGLLFSSTSDDGQPGYALHVRQSGDGSDRHGQEIEETWPAGGRGWQRDKPQQDCSQQGNGVRKRLVLFCYQRSSENDLGTRRQTAG
jgi:hypothetical protein